MEPTAGSLSEARLFARTREPGPCAHDAPSVVLALAGGGEPATYRAERRCTVCGARDASSLLLDDDGAGSLAPAAEWWRIAEALAARGDALACEGAIEAARRAIERDPASRVDGASWIDALRARRGPVARAHAGSELATMLAARGERVIEERVLRPSRTAGPPLAVELAWSIERGSLSLRAPVVAPIPSPLPRAAHDVLAIASAGSLHGTFVHDPAAIVYVTHLRLDPQGAVPVSVVRAALDECQRAADRFGAALDAACEDVRPPALSRSRTEGLRQIVTADRAILEVSRVLSGAGLACAVRRFDFAEWYCGAPVAPAEHPFVRGRVEEVRSSPLGRGILEAACGACASREVLVLAARASSSMGGDAYYDLELRCAACGLHTLVSYAEND